MTAHIFPGLSKAEPGVSQVCQNFDHPFKKPLTSLESQSSWRRGALGGGGEFQSPQVPITRRHSQAGTAPSPRGNHLRGLWGMGRERRISLPASARRLSAILQKAWRRPAPGRHCALSPWRPPSGHSGSRLCAVRRVCPEGETLIPFLLSRLRGAVLGPQGHLLAGGRWSQVRGFTAAVSV